MYFFQDVKWEGVCGGWGVWDDWEGDGRGGIYRDESLCSLITFMFVCQYLFFFDKKGRLPIKKMNPKNTRLSKKTPITHKEFNQKIPTF